MAKVHRTNNRELIKHIKSVTIPYNEIIKELEQDGEVFLEEDDENPLRRQTIWRAAKRLSSALGKPVRYDRALLRIDGVDVLHGFSFSIEDQRSQDQKDKSA